MTIRDGVTSPVSLAALGLVVRATLDAAGGPRSASIGLILSDDDELRALNARHMGIDHATDVLSFPLLTPADYPPHAGQERALGRPAVEFPLPAGTRPHLGDVVVSIERARVQASGGRGGQTGDVRWSVADEVRLLVVHGTLHVCGWDHARADEEAAMRALERRLLAQPERS